MHSNRDRVALVALTLSGVAGLINQVCWQRALKIYLGGSEGISSMLVVLVFMLGLGLGAALYARLGEASRSSFLARIEGFLALINIVVALTLSMGLSSTMFRVQLVALALGLPLRAIYCLLALLLLLLPCMLMGITTPAAASLCQRTLGWRDSRQLALVFFANTGGAVLGALLSGFVLIPGLGQIGTLLFAASLNGAAGLLFWWVTSGAPSVHLQGETVVAPPSVPLQGETVVAPPSVPLQGETVVAVVAPAVDSSLLTAGVWQWTGFCLGLLSLAYEMYLFRMAPLKWGPWPSTFSLVLSAFLLTWSLGTLAAGRWSLDLKWLLWTCAVCIASVPLLVYQHRFGQIGQLGNLLIVVYLIPCFIFGWLYAQLVALVSASTSASSSGWGADVGRFHALNTLGSCLGIVVATLIGYEVRSEYLGWAISAGLLMILAALNHLDVDQQSTNRSNRTTGTLARGLSWVSLVVLMVASWGLSPLRPANFRDYFGRDGVIEVDGGNLYWDGLWHSTLTVGGHVGTPNWYMGAVPLALHPGRANLKCLVVGLGTGITAATLSSSSAVGHVDAYDINHKLLKVFQDYPLETRHCLSDSKVRLIWQDARSGLALGDQQYDIITQAPLWLSQAGSSILLSREYMQLVASHLKPGGLFVVYTNGKGNLNQPLLIRQTVRSVFAHTVSINQGYMLVASHSPIDVQANRFRQLEECDDEFGADLRNYRQRNSQGLVQTIDPLGAIAWSGLEQRFPWPENSLWVTDDRPLIEYPRVLPYIAAGTR